MRVLGTDFDWPDKVWDTITGGSLRRPEPEEDEDASSR